MNEFVLTDRMKDVMKRVHNRTKVVAPVDLFHEIYEEGKGVCSEVKLLIDWHANIDWSKHLFVNEKEAALIEGVAVDSSTLAIFEEARGHMERYGQVQIQVGHVIGALVGTTLLDFLLTDTLKTRIEEVACRPRDLICSLEHGFPQSSVAVRCVKESDQERLENWVLEEFGERWTKQVEQAFGRTPKPNIFVVEEVGRLVGFACFDVVDAKKGVFGPMGTTRYYRQEGVGKALLYHCLNEMKEVGYAYAIIGQAGPIEFYEKTCKAKVIPF